MGAIVPGEGRLMSLLERVDGVLSAEGVTTVEMLLVGRQLMPSATVQPARDRSASRQGGACCPLALGFAAWLVQELVRLPGQERDARTRRPTRRPSPTGWPPRCASPSAAASCAPPSPRPEQ